MVELTTECTEHWLKMRTHFKFITWWSFELPPISVFIVESNWNSRQVIKIRSIRQFGDIVQNYFSSNHLWITSDFRLILTGILTPCMYIMYIYYPHHKTYDINILLRKLQKSKLDILSKLHLWARSKSMNAMHRR